MSFPESVSKIALVSCGRCCCICHKFCGTKIELHHIKQRAYDGEDELDNCIPLCFECHADMGKADPKHPKGKHYSEAELKAHRDSWYEKVKNAPLLNSGENISESDKKLFSVICDVFTPDIQYWLKEVDIGGFHPLEVFDSLIMLLHRREDPFFEFLNIEIEKLKGNLFSSINEFLSYKAHNTFSRMISGKSVGVTRQWMVNHEDWIPNHTDDDDYHARFQDEVKQLNNLATTVWESYSEFARQSRRLLNL